jgi:hypothetical protein
VSATITLGTDKEINMSNYKNVHVAGAAADAGIDLEVNEVKKRIISILKLLGDPEVNALLIVGVKSFMTTVNALKLEAAEQDFNLMTKKLALIEKLVSENRVPNEVKAEIIKSFCDRLML